MYTRDVTDSNGRKRASTGNCNCADGGGGDGHAQLSAHGYEVEPEVFVDASGGEWGPIFGVSAYLFYSFAMLTLDSRRRTIFSLSIDPWTRTSNSS